VKIIAPGKLVLTGAYAVLEGAPAIVVAVDRYAVADVASPDDVDVRALLDASGRKLGLGSSAASMVASAAARAFARGDDLADPVTRARLFREVREAHARAQQGGSGVDVAAAVYGGALRYALDGSGGTRANLRPVQLPDGLALLAFWSGTSARTSDLVARVDVLRARSGLALGGLRQLAACAAAAVDAGDAPALISAARGYGRALEALGHAADAPIVPPTFAELAKQAEDDGAAFLPSGAGGGDVAVWVGPSAPPFPRFVDRARELGMSPLPFSMDRGGVRPRLSDDQSP
jgi:phosphomevalonate kinase